MFRWLRRQWTSLAEWWGSLRTPQLDKRPAPKSLPLPYRVVQATEDPDRLAPRTIYAVGENETLWHVVLLCPCDCGATIGLNLLPDDEPRWSLHNDEGGPTLKPSVWRTSGCRSHFFLRRGQIVWCRPEAADLRQRDLDR